MLIFSQNGIISGTRSVIISSTSFSETPSRFKTAISSLKFTDETALLAIIFDTIS